MRMWSASAAIVGIAAVSCGGLSGFQLEAVESFGIDGDVTEVGSAYEMQHQGVRDFVVAADDLESLRIEAPAGFRPVTPSVVDSDLWTNVGAWRQDDPRCTALASASSDVRVLVGELPPEFRGSARDARVVRLEVSCDSG